MSRLDFTGVIEEHNEVHHRQRQMELPVRLHVRIISILPESLGHFSPFNRVPEIG